MDVRPRPTGTSRNVRLRSDIEIAQTAEKRPIAEVAAVIGLDIQDLISYGPYIAKVPHTVAVKYADRPAGQARAGYRHDPDAAG